MTSLRVQLPLPVNADLQHRLRNLGEDIHRALDGKGSVDMAEVDAVTDHFSVAVHSRRDLGDVDKILERLIARSFSDVAVQIVKE